MKQPPSEGDSLQNFKPSKFSADGFMGNDKRSVEDIVIDDGLKLQELGVTNYIIAAKLKEIYNTAKNALGAQIKIGENLVAQYYESRGKIPSPFRGEGMFEKGEVTISDTRTGQTIVVTSLGIHLIEKHTFFQGNGSRYRLDPQIVVTMLKL